MLTFDDYKSYIKELPFGKRVGRNVYILWKDLEDVSPVLFGYIKPLNDSNAEIIKFFLDQFKISLLNYPGFFSQPIPVLQKSTTIDLSTGKKRQIHYSKEGNPPILHRKETMISPKREENESWISLTKELEENGCFVNPNKIGFKQYWDNLLNDKGLYFDGCELKKCHAVVQKVNEERIQIDRHKTAMSRSDFSRPVQLLIKYGLLRKENTFLDYGCGLGDDVRALEFNGYKTSAWDPVYRSNGEKIESDIVNLGFVLNVIEDPIERIDTLHQAFKYSKKVLSVAVVTDIAPTAKNIRPYKDGFLTSRKTFQKYYKHEEAHDFIEEALNCSAYSVSQGVFYIFKNEQDGQDFLSSRQKRSVDWNKLNLNIYPSKDERARVRTEVIYGKYKDELEAYWEQLLSLGRAPSYTEYPEMSSFLDELKMSPKKLQDWFIERYGSEALEVAFNNRHDDLLVYLGLANFKRRIPFTSLSTSLKYDIKTFFGSYKVGQQEALVELYKIGNPEEIDSRCHLINEKIGIGRLDEQALYLNPAELSALDPVLRMYVGVAELLWGNVDEVAEIKIHKRSGKVTFIIKESPDLKPGEYFRIKVDLSRQKVDFFRHKN